jgi:WD40 repeat protein
MDPTGRLYAAGDENVSLRLHDVKSGKVVRDLGVKPWAVDHGVFSPRGDRIALVPPPANVANPPPIRVHPTAGDGPPVELAEPGPVSAVAFAPDGKRLAVLSPDQGKDRREEVIRLWDLATGKEARRITGLEATSRCLVFSPDGKLLAVGNLQRMALQLFDPATGKEVCRVRCLPSVKRLAFSPDGKTLAAGKYDGQIGLWDVASGRPLPQSPAAEDYVAVTGFAAGGRELLTSGGELAARDWRSGRVVRRYADPWEDWFAVPVLSPDRRLVAVCRADGSIRLVDAVNGKETLTLRGHTAPADKLLFTPDGRRLFSHGYDNTVRVWDVAAGKQLHALDGGAANSGDQMAVAPDGKVLATSRRPPGGNEPSEIRLWDVASGRQLLRIPVAMWGFFALAFSPDGSLLAVAGGRDGSGGQSPGTVVVWDAATGREVRSFAGHRGAVHGVAFSPDGHALATGGEDRTVRLWEVASGRERHRFTGHETAVFSLAFSPDGAVLAATSADAPVFVWDVTDTAGRVRAAAALSAAERDRLWQQLSGDDAEAAFAALRRLLAYPDAAAALVRQHVRPVPAQDAARVRQLIQDLDSDRFAEREKAEAALRGMADLAAAELREARQRADSAELRRRLDNLLRQADEPTPERVTQARALELLEHLATPDAVKCLDELAAGAPPAWLTREAAVARERLRRRS